MTGQDVTEAHRRRPPSDLNEAIPSERWPIFYDPRLTAEQSLVGVPGCRGQRAGGQLSPPRSSAPAMSAGRITGVDGSGGSCRRQD